MQTTLLGAFAGIAVVLASIGVYGVIAYGVGQRTREFGIRLALGARRVEIAGLMRRGVMLFAGGAAIGLLAAAASARLLGGLLFHVTALDRASFSVLCTLNPVHALAGSDVRDAAHATGVQEVLPINRPRQCLQ